MSDPIKRDIEKAAITIETLVNAPMEKVWQSWIQPEHVKGWNTASEDWHCPFGENDFSVGGKFSYRMEARDGSYGFDFWGIYDRIIKDELIAYTLGDDRKVEIIFSSEDGKIRVKETFEAETENSLELQRQGWQAILDNFKKYTENRL